MANFAACDTIHLQHYLFFHSICMLQRKRLIGNELKAYGLFTEDIETNERIFFHFSISLCVCLTFSMKSFNRLYANMHINFVLCQVHPTIVAVNPNCSE